MLKSQVLVDFFSESNSQLENSSSNQFEDVASKTIFLGSESLQQQYDTPPVSNSSSNIDVLSDFFATSSCDTCTIDDDDIPFDESEANAIKNLYQKVKSKVSKKSTKNDPVVTPTPIVTPTPKNEYGRLPPKSPIKTRKDTIYSEINPAPIYQKMPKIPDNQYGQMPEKNTLPPPNNTSQYAKIDPNFVKKYSKCEEDKTAIEMEKNKVENQIRYKEKAINDLQVDITNKKTEIQKLESDLNEKKKKCQLINSSSYDTTKTSMSIEDILNHY
jgi:hypothetical protein